MFVIIYIERHWCGSGRMPGLWTYQRQHSLNYAVLPKTKKEGRFVKSTHLRKRIVAALLAVVLAVSLAAPSLAIEETGVSKSGSNGLTWEEIDSSSVQV